MSSRTPPILPSALDEEQKTIYNKMHAMASAVFGDKFRWQDDNQSLIGPMSVLLHTPRIADIYYQLAGRAREIPGLSLKAREVAILTTGAMFQSKYEVYAHGILAVEAGLSSTQVEAIKAGNKPSSDSTWDGDCDLAFDIANALTKSHGSLSTGLWNRGKEAFGRDGMLALIQYVALYSYTCILLNAVDEPVPGS